MSDGDLSGTTLGGFELGELLGAGAFGSVYRARQLRLGRDVAVKILDPSLARDPDAARRFEREGRSAASLDHPAIVPVYQAGEDGGIVWLAMRYVDGETLADRLDREGTLDIATAVSILRPIAEGLDHAHDKDIVHRDVKPSNILLEADGRVWLADFGIAATTAEVGSYTTGAIGTAFYMSPEQASARSDLDGASDRYSLACVVHRCVTGRVPFEGPDLVSTLVAHVNDPVPSSGDDALDAFFATALAKQPDARFPSAVAMVDALAQLATSATPRPAPPPPPPPPPPVSDRGAADDDTDLATTFAEAASAPSGAPPSRRRWLVVAAVVAIVAGMTGALVLRSDSEPVVAASTTTSSSTSTTTTEPPEPAFDTNRGVAIGIDQAIAVLDPNRVITSEWLVTRHVLPPLVDVAADFSLTPWLAESLPTIVADEPFTAEWTLRADATWEDGTPITSADVEATLGFLRDPASGAQALQLYESVDQLQVIDQRTFRIVFTEPTAAFRLLFSTNHPVIKKAALDAYRNEFSSVTGFLDGPYDFSGGPYRITAFTDEDGANRVTFRRNDAYWGEAAPLREVEVRQYLDGGDAVDALADGDIDVLWSTDPTIGDLTTAASLDGVAVEAGFTNLVDRVHFNTRSPPLDDPLLRLALAHAIDRRGYVREHIEPVRNGPAEFAASIVWHDGHERWSPDGPFSEIGDGAEASRLFAAAGWFREDEDGFLAKDGQRLELDIAYLLEADSLALDGAITSSLEDAGVALSISPYRETNATERADFFATRSEGRFDILVDSRAISTDPLITTLEFSGSECPTSLGIPGCTSTRGVNWTGIDDPTLTDILDRAAAETDAVARDDLLDQADALLAELMPSLPIVRRPALLAHREGLLDITADAHRGGPVTLFDRWGWIDETTLPPDDDTEADTDGETGE